MPDHLVIERLEFNGHCGVTEAERQLPQPIAVDVELDYPLQAIAAAAATDAIGQAVDYASVAQCLVDLGTSRRFHLLETMAEQMVTAIFAGFPVDRIGLWVRKVDPPVKYVNGSVGIRLDRLRSGRPPDLLPAQFLLDQKHRFPRISHTMALDVACGRGRNALYLAEQGFTVDAVDRDEQALAELSASATQRQQRGITTHTLDLETDASHPPTLPRAYYDVITVFFYLHRLLFPALVRALTPGGVLIYETFTIENHLRRQHPRRREFCLEPNELLTLAQGLRVLHYEEGEHIDSHGTAAFTARLLAERPA
ncbi:MAG: dihydroneopterin aldolase [Nitrospira sp.]